MRGGSGWGSGNVSILLNQGNGTFAGALSYATGSTPYFVEAGDLDGDGDLDLVLPSQQGPGTVSILMNTGSGAFGPHIPYGVGSAPTSVALADLDADGDLDVAVTCSSTKWPPAT